jgi:hypothetical protein
MGRGEEVREGVVSCERGASIVVLVPFVENFSIWEELGKEF